MENQMLDDTTQSDLEQLLAEQDVGWCAYHKDGPIIVGIGGCLTEQMERLLEKQGVARNLPTTRMEHVDRKMAMIEALGFTITRSNGRTYAYPSGMFAWNDAQTDPDMIRHRIKDALNGESNAR
jgi:hypothetical protein